ncbi:MAG: LuxR C-terminal-related transcriptional regulator [Actinomycetota bacterium]|nr:LuxR C-terminal-related transcriptional regulator [Actinomycetota bacterium]
MADLPVYLTALIGREADVAGVSDLLLRRRLVTVVGPGGVGKTRVAVAIASGAAARYPDGAWLVDVGEAGDGSELWARVAAASGLKSYRSGGGSQTVLAHLRNRHALLVLDSCEHVIHACSDVALSVARACPQVSLLLTSRQPLGVEGEWLWPLTGLAVDPPDQCRGLPAVASPAVRLFVERARAQNPRFSLDPHESALVAELCRRLDGLPLAIELAAARVAVLSPQEILARSDDPLSLLVGGGPVTPDDHRSIAASLDRSHHRLSEAEAVLFRRLAVFTGGFTLAAAEAVCSSPPLDDGRILDGLASLVGKSLVVAETAGGETRYRLAETTRVYAADRLASAGETAGLRERHARWFLAFVKDAEPHVRHPLTGPLMVRLTADHDNVEAAIDWAVGVEQTDWALQMAAAMATFWRAKGQFGTAREWLARALALPDPPVARRAEALLALGHLVGESGDRPGAIDPLREALRLANEAGEAGTEARILNLLGYFRLFCDVPTTALPPLERSGEMARHAGDRRTLLGSLSSAGWAATLSGDVRMAEARFSQCLAAARGTDHGPGEIWPAVVGMGCVALLRGRLGEAEAKLIEAVATADLADSELARAVVWCQLGQVARARGDYAQASALLSRSLSHARKGADPFPVAMRLALLGSIAHDQGDLNGAERVLLEALAVPGAAELPFADAQRLLALGSLRVTQRREEEAAVLLDTAAAVATAHDFRGITAAVLVEQGRLRRLGDDLQAAARTLTRAIQLHDRLGDVLALVDALELLGGVRASQGRCRTACRLLAAASAARVDSGGVRPPIRTLDHERDVASVRSGLGPEEWDVLWAGGASLSISAAAAVAARCHGRRDSVRSGWDAITPTEREVVALVAEGLTNREAAARLVVSTRTVETHVAHVLAKLGLSSRRELARVASAKGFRATT